MRSYDGYKRQIECDVQYMRSIMCDCCEEYIATRFGREYNTTYFALTVEKEDSIKTYDICSKECLDKKMYESLPDAKSVTTRNKNSNEEFDKNGTIIEPIR